ncbi:MAG: DUF2190 family protein [Magnetococcales bacterium]|nr:DUF2190 family protein [Magnetococcales bacterium]
MSQQNISVLTLTLIASGAVTANRGIGFDGAQATSQGQKVMGSAVTDSNSGSAVAVITNGTAIMESGAAISIGDSLIVDSQGRIIPASTLAVASGATPVTGSAANGAILEGSDLPEFIIADAMQAASAAGKMIEVLLRR